MSTLGNLIPWRRARGESENPVQAFRREMTRFLDDFMRLGEAAGPSAELFPQHLRLDLAEDERAIRVSVELPGVDAEDVDVSIRGDVLTIRGEKRAEHEERTKNVIRRERSFGSFTRSVELPVEVDPERVSASFDRGILQIELPKSADPRNAPKRIPVSASSGEPGRTRNR
jgi:HSP20 family protein